MVLTLPVILYLLAFLLCISFFFSLSEASLIAINKIKLKHMANQGVKKAKIAYELITHLDRLITTIVVGNNFVNVAISAFGALLCIRLLGEKWGIVVAPFVVAAILLIFGEITPKIIALTQPDRIGLLVAGLMKRLVITLHPIVVVLTVMVNFIIRLFGVHPRKRSPIVTEEEIRMMVELGKEEGVLSDDERNMLHRIFEFGDTLVKDVMIPKDRIIAIDINASCDDLFNLLLEEGHSRIPVYEDSRDNIKGIIYARDILYVVREKGLIIIPELVHPAYFISENKRVSELLREFQQKNIQLAIIKAQDGGIIGLVTLEDLIEEIVGEIT